MTKKKFTTMIVQSNKENVSPTYMGKMENFKKNKIEKTQLFFYNDDINCCMKVLRWKWILFRPHDLVI